MSEHPQNRAKGWFSIMNLRRVLFPILTLTVVVLLFVRQGNGLIDFMTNTEQSVWLLILALAIYTLILAIPFMPSVEFGWLIMALFGIPGILGAWVATWLGLLLGFTLGRLFEPTPWYQRRLALINKRMHRHESENATGWLARVIGLSRKHPFLFIALALNVPGNWVIGGGGGVALLASLVLQLRWWRFLLVVIPATGFIPMLLLLGLIQTPG